VHESGAALEKIVAGVDDTREKIRDIFASTVETSSGIGEISKATRELDKDTQQNAAIFSDNTETASALRQEARSLKEAVAAFDLGHNHTAVPQFKHAS
ncbi:MAG: methyl-accepting chemotaxis protein, partial [Pseudomonadota bacterium]